MNPVPFVSDSFSLHIHAKTIRDEPVGTKMQPSASDLVLANMQKGLANALRIAKWCFIVAIKEEFVYQKFKFPKANFRSNYSKNIILPNQLRTHRRI